MNRKLKNEELRRLKADEFVRASKLPVVLVLDNIRSHHNTGSVFRTADAFRVERIVLCGMTPCPPHREIHKTALGATETVSWEYFDRTIDALRVLRKNGFRIVSVEQAENAVFLDRAKLQTGRGTALVFGNEVFGVDQEVIDYSDEVWEIPQFGTKHSLNISVSAGVVLWEMVRKLNWKG